MRRVMLETGMLFTAFLLILIAWLMILTDSARADELETIQRQIASSAVRHGVDPALALSIAEVESQFNPEAKGALGEIGVFQLRPEYHPVVKGHTRQNIEVAIAYLARLKHECRAYGDAFFVCYNYGTARKLKYPRKFPYYLKVKAAQQRRQGFQHVARN